LTAIIAVVPDSAGKHMPVEIEVNDFFGAGPAVQKERLVQGNRTRGGNRAAVQCRGRLRQRESLIRIEQTAVRVHRERVIAPEQVGQLFNGFSVCLRDGRQMFSKDLDGLLAARGRRQSEWEDWSGAMFDGWLGVCAERGGET